MNFEEFKNVMNMKLADINIELSESKIKHFYKYMEELIEWNNKINLTAILEPTDIVDKHFVDSLTISKYIEENKSVIDVGTGAGFPGIPLKIVRDDLKIELMDSLNKRILFLNEMIKELELKNIVATHGRAEDEAKKQNKREQYDVAVSRAVANLPVLLEYLLPFVKENGICICMKGSNIEEEVKISQKALQELGGKIEKIDNLVLPGTDNVRNILVVKKIKKTPQKYPRKAGTATKAPIL